MSSGKSFMYEIIYKDLLEGIMDGTYPGGSRLPSEKELAKSYGVSRITSKRALEMLADKELISRTPGRGSYVLETKHDMDKAETSSNISVNTGKMIGVILDSFAGDFGALLLRSIEQACRRKGFNMLLKCTYGSVEEENKAIRSAAELGVQGLIVMCVQNETYNTTLVQLALNKFPIVLVDRKMHGIPIPCITTNNYAASRELTNLLIQRGHKSLGFVTHSSTNTSSIKERYEGFTDCIMEYAGIDGHILEIPGYNPTPEDAQNEKMNFDREKFRELLQNNKECTAFLAIEAKLCSILYRELSDMKLEREVVSFDGMGSADKKNVIAYIRQNEKEMGFQAVSVLEEVIQGANINNDIYVPYMIESPNDI